MENLNAEQTLIVDWILYDKNQSDILAIDENYFSDDRLREIYLAMMEILQAGDEITLPNLNAQLQDKKHAIKKDKKWKGWAEYLAKLMAGGDYVPAHYKSALAQVRKIRQLRQIKEIGRNLFAREKELNVNEIDDLIEFIEKKLVDVRTIDDGKQFKLATGESAMITTIDRIKDFKSQNIVNKYVGTGTAIDRILVGFEPTHLNILAGRTSHGKSAMGVQILDNAISNNRGVLFVSLEMTKEQIITRLISRRTGIKATRLQYGWIDSEQMLQVEALRNEMKGLPFYIYDNPRVSVMDIEYKVREILRKQSLDIVIIDYLQLLKPLDRRLKRYEQLGEQTRFLTDMAKKYDISVLALAQLGRNVEGSKELPKLSDLRESGNIEQDAGKIIFLWYPAKQGVHRYRYEDYRGYSISFEGEELKDIVIIGLVKNRFGMTGWELLKYESDYMRFEDYKDEREKKAEVGNLDIPV